MENTPCCDFIFKSSVSVLAITFDASGSIIRANVFSEALCGRTLLGTNVSDLFVNFDENTDILSLLTAGENPLILNISTAHALPEALIFHCYACSSPNDHHILFGEYNTAEMENFRSQLISMNGELNIATRKLHKQHADLKRINEAMNNLMGMAAHDLRNPIALIMGYAQTMIDFMSDKFDKKQKLFLNSIFKASKLMNDIITDMLDVTVIESGTVKLRLEDAQIADVIGDAVETGAILADRKNVKLLYPPPSPIPSVSLDRSKIQQVMDNLISNAIKYSTAGTEINIQVAHVPDEGCVKISVSDAGLGIPADEIKNIFKPFVKLTPRPTANESSTGLGMAIVKKIVEAHRGKIWVESKLGSGTTVTFTLPTV